MNNLDTYNEYFFNSQVSQSSDSAREILPLINEWLSPKSIIDIGCGVGAWLNEYRKIENVQITGVDGEYVDKNLILIPEENFISADLNEKIPQLKKHDLLICLEVAEHLTKERAVSFISEITHLSDVILFSAAVPGQEGTHHFNEQFLSYWIPIFKSNGFDCFDIIRPHIWNNEAILWWYRQNVVLFVREGNEKAEMLKTIESFHGFDLIHKQLFIHKTNKCNQSENKVSNLIKNPLFYMKSIVKNVLNKFK